MLPTDKILLIEQETIKTLINKYKIKLDCLFFDSTNFFTSIDSANTHCDLPKRDNNKKKSYDLRQIGMAPLVTREDQLPLTYEGNKNDITVFKETFNDLASRLRSISENLTDVTVIFDKGNNSKDNFKMIDNAKNIHYVGDLSLLISAH